jgi:hypothetical protein
VACVRGWRVFPVLPLGVCALIASGCGIARQDAHEAKGTFTMKVIDSSFPESQAIARPTSLELQVQNTSASTVPNVAVTLDSFYYTSHYPELAANKRPVWVVEQGPGPIAKPPIESEAVSPPGGGQTTYVNTWALGPLAPGGTQTFVWRVVPVKAGIHTVHYTVAAGLAGKAKAALASGGQVQGELTANIAPAPPATHVDPSTGRVTAGAFPLTP